MTARLNIAHVTYSGKGGAGIAARRISAALTAAGHRSDFIVAEDPPDDAAVSPRPALQRYSSKLDRAALRLYRNRARTIWTNNVGPGVLPDWLRSHRYDIVNLHWMGEGFLPVNLLARVNRPVVWTMHDAWPFTGGCHYSGGCRGYEARCGACPQLGSQRAFDLSRWNRLRKARAFRRAPVFLASPSAWLAEAAGASSTLGHRPVRVIRNAVDLDVFRPRNAARLRQEMGLPTEGRLVLIGAGPSGGPSRKGAQFVQPFMDTLRRALPATQVSFLAFGKHPPQDGLVSLGYLSGEDQMAKLYAAVDLFLLPTTEDNLPNTIAESAAAGTPAAAFAVGGLPEMIDDGETGLLAPPYDVAALARAAAAALNDPARLAALGAAARALAEASYAPGIVARGYAAYYRDILADSTGGV